MNRIVLLFIIITLSGVGSYHTLRGPSFLTLIRRISSPFRCLKNHRNSRLFSTASKHITTHDTKFKPRKKPTWEEIYNTNPLKADVPNVEYHPPREWFTKLFACYATIDTKEALMKRSDAWVHHMQWARRSVLAEGLRDLIPSEQLQDAIPNAKVEAEYTFLSEDRMYPTAQLVILRANSSTTAMEYLDKEPLKKHGGVSSWQVFEMKPEHLNHEETENDDDDENPLHEILQSDLMNPFMFLTLPSSVSVNKVAELQRDLQAERRKTATECSLHYHIQAALNKTTTTAATYLPLYANESRVALLGRLYPAHSTEASADKVALEETTLPPVAGQILLFNARSRADALRYLRQDPVAAASTLQGDGKEVLFNAVSAHIVADIQHCTAVQ